jgi:hypothetical protein
VHHQVGEDAHTLVRVSLMLLKALQEASQSQMSQISLSVLWPAWAPGSWCRGPRAAAANYLVRGKEVAEGDVLQRSDALTLKTLAPR